MDKKKLSSHKKKSQKKISSPINEAKSNTETDDHADDAATDIDLERQAAYDALKQLGLTMGFNQQQLEQIMNQDIDQHADADVQQLDELVEEEQKLVE
jgi:hypothetical protein